MPDRCAVFKCSDELRSAQHGYTRARLRPQRAAELRGFLRKCWERQWDPLAFSAPARLRGKKTMRPDCLFEV